MSHFLPPPVPPWEGLHVLVVHFPIALLLVAPLFVLLATVFPIRAQWASWAAVALLLLGATGTFVAIATGDAAQAVADGSDAMYDVLSEHEELAELTRNVYVVLTAVYALFVLLPAMMKELLIRRYLVPVNFVFLVALGAGSLLLANTAHLGGRLVHEFGVKAVLATAVESAETPAPSEKPQSAPVEPESKPEPPPAEPKPDPVQPAAVPATAEPTEAKPEESSAQPEPKPAEPVETTPEPKVTPAEPPAQEAKPEEPQMEPKESEAKQPEPEEAKTEPKAAEADSPAKEAKPEEPKEDPKQKPAEPNAKDAEPEEKIKPEEPKDS